MRSVRLRRKLWQFTHPSHPTLKFWFSITGRSENPSRSR